jgi:hypothetical protein
VTGHDQGRTGKDQRWFSATCTGQRDNRSNSVLWIRMRQVVWCGDANKNYPDGRERLSGIVGRVCAVNRGGGNLTPASSLRSAQSDARSHHTLMLFFLLTRIHTRHPSRPDKMATRRQKHRQQRWRDWRCFRYITTPHAYASPIIICRR